MPTNKAISATPAASRTRAPQLGRRTAAKGQEPRESRGPSDMIVSEAAQPLHGLIGLNQRTDAPTSPPSEGSGIYAFQPFIFDWYANPLQKNFETMHFVDNKAKAIIGETIAFLRDSETFCLLYSKYTDAREAGAKRSRAPRGDDDGPTEYDVDFAMCARCYLAGTLRSTSSLDAIHTIPDGMDGDE